MILSFVREQGPDKAFSFLVSFPLLSRWFSGGSGPREEAPRQVERALRRGGSFLPGFYCSVLETKPHWRSLR